MLCVRVSSESARNIKSGYLGKSSLAMWLVLALPASPAMIEWWGSQARAYSTAFPSAALMSASDALGDRERMSRPNVCSTSDWYFLNATWCSLRTQWNDRFALVSLHTLVSMPSIWAEVEMSDLSDSRAAFVSDTITLPSLITARFALPFKGSERNWVADSSYHMVL